MALEVIAGGLLIAVTLYVSGYRAAFGSFFGPYDRFADFLKVVLALPGPLPAKGFGDAMVQYYSRSRDYYVGNSFAMFHMAPFPMLLALSIRWLFASVSPVVTFAALVVLFYVGLAAALLRRGVRWVVAAVLSYPVVMLVDRGNLWAGLTGICLIAALLRRKPDWIAALLFAVAVNIRPNAAICALPLILLDWRFAVRLAVAAGALLLVGFVGSHAIWPDYTLANFVSGLALYAKVYAADGLGIPTGSSMYGGLYALGLRHAYIASTLLGLSALPPAVFLYSRRQLSYDAFVFICCAATAMATTIFGDYHLIVFIAPLVLARSWAVAVFSMLLLIPKGYWVIGGSSDITIQVVLNPAIALAASWLLIFRTVGPMRNVQHGAEPDSASQILVTARLSPKA